VNHSEPQPETTKSETFELTTLLKSFSAEQLDFLAARMFTKTDKAAAADCELSYDTVCHWTNKKDVNRAVKLAKMDSVQLAFEKLRRLAPVAVDVLDDEMSKGRKRRLDAARDVLDRSGLVQPKRHELTGSDGGPVEYRNVSDFTDEERFARIMAVFDGARARRDNEPN
jgi:hypothetical protein